MQNGATGMGVSRQTSVSIDVTRGLAALGVIWGHSIYSMNAPLALNGAFWVWVFLPLSGFLVARSFGPGGYTWSFQGISHFVWNRALRLVPLAEAALLLGLLFAWIGGVENPPHLYRQFLFVAPLNNTSLVGPLWTVAAELQFYLAAVLLLPVMKWCWARAGVLGGVGLWVVATWAGQRWIEFAGDSASQPRTMLGNVSFFVFGLLLAQPQAVTLRIPRWTKAVLVGAVVATAWYLENYRAQYFWRWSNSGWPFGGAAACAAVIAAIVVLVETPSGGPRWLGRLAAPLAWCGFYTYGIYVLHSVLAAANSAIWHVKPGWTRLAILMCAVPIAPWTYRYFERRWLSLKVDRPARERTPLVQ